MISTIAALCGFYLYSPFTIPKKLEMEFSIIHHRRCIYSYYTCMNGKMRGAKPSTWKDDQKEDWMWACVAAENGAVKIHDITQAVKK